MKYCPYCRKRVNVKCKKIYPLIIIVILLWGVARVLLNIIDGIENQTIQLMLWCFISIAAFICFLMCIYLNYELIRSKEKCELCGMDLSKSFDYDNFPYSDKLLDYYAASNERIKNMNDHNILYDKFYKSVNKR